MEEPLYRYLPTGVNIQLSPSQVMEKNILFLFFVTSPRFFRRNTILRKEKAPRGYAVEERIIVDFKIIRDL
jgi:hypothetical protein